MEHVEEAGVHSGDSACLLPPVNLPAAVIATLERHTRAIATELQVVGLLNVQYAVPRGPVGTLGANGDASPSVYVLEANPRASRTVPFVAKATGVPLVKLATLAMMGRSLADIAVSGSVDGWTGPVPTLGATEPWRQPEHISVKEAVLPFNRFPGVDAVLGPEMRCTGEVMGIDRRPGLAFAKSQIAAGAALPTSGSVFLSLADRDKTAGVIVARRLADMGFTLLATRGTAASLAAAGVETDEIVAKLGDPDGPHAVALLDDGRIDLVINTPQGRGPRADGADIRRAAAQRGVPLLTTVAAALAATAGIADQRDYPMEVRTLQEYHREMRERA